jgi:glycosyltransferase involved in cell wall biosynthesis
VKLAVVVQRYGADINGGAEQHARYIAERLARHAEVEVLTTCAQDYVTWRNDLPAGTDLVNGVTVRRFPVGHERDPDDFGRRSVQVFERTHSLHDELGWLDSEGPASRALVRYVTSTARVRDYFLFFSYRYYHAHHGVRAVPSKAVLVPTAERDPAVGLGIFGPIFRGVRAVMYNSEEERALIHGASGNQHVAGPVVGVGSEIPAGIDPARFREKFGLTGPYAIYVGRIDDNKGCPELFDFFLSHLRATRSALTLALVGRSVLPIPSHPRIRHLGFLDDRDKFDGIAGATAVMMPSYFESLSMVALEGWALGRAVVANGRCDVLKGQCLRSNAGLFYENRREFIETLGTIEANRPLREMLGANGRRFYERHYAWPVIDRKYLDTLERLAEEDRAGKPSSRAPEPLPGWFARRRRTLPPSREVVDAIPAGPVVPRARREAS